MLNIDCLVPASQALFSSDIVLSASSSKLVLSRPTCKDFFGGGIFIVFVPSAPLMLVSSLICPPHRHSGLSVVQTSQALVAFFVFFFCLPRWSCEAYLVPPRPASFCFGVDVACL